MERLKENLTGGRSADSQEQAQELENAEVVDALGNEARSEISKIAKALDQIKNRTYGICARLRRDDSDGAARSLSVRRPLHSLRHGRRSRPPQPLTRPAR